tara:strand:- start:953 stop:1141 length:189 start_codon:yes stop_codon:yes gene_type:complete
MLDRYGDMDLKCSPLTLLCRGDREGFVLSESLVSGERYIHPLLNEGGFEGYMNKHELTKTLY